MKKLKLISFLLFVGLIAHAQQSFDWNNYQVWNNSTAYSKTYVVNQRHPNASDDNPGTKDSPFKTINKAAQVVTAGQRVLIYAGVYRESIEPKNEGKSSDRMISYEAAPGERVIVKGSKILNLDWVQRRVLTDAIPDTTLTYTWSRKIWVTEVPDSFFENDYYPFQIPNILPEEHKMMPWAKLVKKLAPYTSTRGLIFQNGERMTQLEHYGDLTRVEGSFWVDDDGKTLHIHPFGSGNPNLDLFELGVQSHLFKPQKVGMGYIQIRGITFEHCANGFLRTSTGAITALGGHHWIVEDNVIRNMNSSGLEFGYFAYEPTDPNPQNVLPRKDKNLGGMIIRNNEIYNCGTAGIRSFVVNEAIITNNHIYNCGWQDAENYWECSGIKILLATRTLVKGNHIHHIQGGNGIWLDWDIQYSRVTANVIHDIQNIQGGIFVEASHTPNLVDNNFIWNIDGNGIYGNDTDFLMIYHNLVANTTGPLVNAVVATDRALNGRKLTATKSKIKGNIFINGGQPINFDSNDHEVDHNLYVTTQSPQSIDLKQWQTTGFDKNSQAVYSFAKFNPAFPYFYLNAIDVKKVPAVKEVSNDYFGTQRTETVYPGPFGDLDTKILLFE